MAQQIYKSEKLDFLSRKFKDVDQLARQAIEAGNDRDYDIVAYVVKILNKDFEKYHREAE